MNDESQLQTLVAQVQSLKQQILLTEATPDRSTLMTTYRKKLDQLIRAIEALDGLAYSSHPDYPDIWQDTLLEVIHRIQEFQQSHESIKKSLVIWINYKLRLSYKIKNLYTSAPTLSLDQPFGSSVRTLAETLPSPYSVSYETLSEDIATRVWTYIQTDPDQKLQNCRMRKYPNCNVQVVAMKLYAKNYFKPNGMGDLTALTQDLGIPYQTFYSWWKKHCLPLLSALVREIGHSLGEDL